MLVDRYLSWLLGVSAGFSRPGRRAAAQQSLVHPSAARVWWLLPVFIRFHTSDVGMDTQARSDGQTMTALRSCADTCLRGHPNPGDLLQHGGRVHRQRCERGPRRGRVGFFQRKGLTEVMKGGTDVVLEVECFGTCFGGGPTDTELSVPSVCEWRRTGRLGFGRDGAFLGRKLLIRTKLKRTDPLYRKNCLFSHTVVIATQ